MNTSKIFIIRISKLNERNKQKKAHTHKKYAKRYLLGERKKNESACIYNGGTIKIFYQNRLHYTYFGMYKTIE